MATVQCVKLNKELPAIDDTTPEGQQALKMALLFGGPELQARLKAHVSLDAWRLWPDHMRMVMNEYRLDPTSDEANKVLAQHMEAFFFEEAKDIPGYVPPEQ